jgi:murein DD-endopeptidase MepM/ murein hydrolase activator NlpD
VRLRTRTPFLRRALLAAVGLALLTPPSPAHAATDPLQAAIDRVTRATQAQHEATARYSQAEGEYNKVQDDAERTQRKVNELQAEQKRLGLLARQRALVAYKRGVTVFDDILGNGSDVLDAARRATVLDRVNAKGNEAIKQLTVVTDDLHARQKVLAKDLDRAEKALAEMKKQEQLANQSLADAQQAEKELRAKLERERREREYARLVAQARADARRKAEAALARSGGGSRGGGSRADEPGSGQVIGSGDWICPVQGAVSFRNDWGEPRSGGRSHKGTDMFAAMGTPVVAPVAGSVWYQTEGTGGKSAYVNGNDGNTYYETHLSAYVGGDRPVKAGEVVGRVGNSGNADGGPSHLHFEIRVGGANGTKINPYPTLAANC